MYIYYSMSVKKTLNTSFVNLSFGKKRSVPGFFLLDML